jgi:16S rRNA (cytosine967-C5)-methyltransferase
VMRNYQRQGVSLAAEIEATLPGRHRHPRWWVERVRAAYPQQWETILAAGNTHPPMTLRVNQRRLSAEAYLAALLDAGIGARRLGGAAVVLDKPCRVELLPGFVTGDVSVQDAAAQRAAPLLDVHEGMQVLDACAAPGGKTGHILELAACELLAVDQDASRARRIAENLSRLRLDARVVVGDCRQPESFWHGRPFDRILLDAPCSASGVVRRHPDIKWLRRERDIEAYAQTQTTLIDALWRVLAPGGKMLYATCSVFPEENAEQVRAFIGRCPHARELLTSADAAPPGEQILPGGDSDGFYYALLAKPI